ncbi:MAG: recombinase family protein [Planctomycetaceae bacterium]|nr:recombinase family protein [Planctomycetaceae bacterium]
MSNSLNGAASAARKNTSQNPQIDPGVPCASYARFSSDLQREESIADQQRKCEEKAALNGHVISPNLEFSDEAVSGTKRHRDGLDAMLAAARAGKFQVLYFHSLSRLSRESVITLPLLKELVYNYRVRIISVTEGIDSNDTAWELIAHIMSIVHEQYLRELSVNVLRGQEGTVLAGLSVGDYCFGYSSEPVSSSEQSPRGRSCKPRKMYVIDRETAAWVGRIFHWFVRERWSLRRIIRELNRLGAPKDHRATTPLWHHQQLLKLLANKKYIGEWPWGQKKNIRDPLTGKIRQEDRSPENCERWTRQLPHLRIVDDETFEKAQELLQKQATLHAPNRKSRGRFAGSSPGSSSHYPRHLLSRLIICGECGRVFNVGGCNGKYLFCPSYDKGVCTCKTTLLRERAERMIIDAIGQRILTNSLWRQRVFEETLKFWREAEAVLPDELAAAQRRLCEVDQKVGNILDRIEAGHGGAELDERLSQRRAEKRHLLEEIDRLQRADHGRGDEPTESWVSTQLAALGDVFTENTPAAAHALRALVGGGITVTEIRRDGHQRHYLQGRFTITSTAIVNKLAGVAGQQSEQAPLASDALAEEIVLDFREAPEIEALSEQAKKLYDDGHMCAEIAKLMGCGRSRVTAMLKYWFESRGMAMPDGRSRRSSLTKKHLIPPRYQEIADEVQKLSSEGLLLQAIANRLGVDRNMITAAIRWWHESQGLPVPDGRTRRKSLEYKGAPKGRNDSELSCGS